MFPSSFTRPFDYEPRNGEAAMLKKAETLEGTPKQSRSERAREVKSGCRPYWEDDQELEAIRDETLTIIRLLTTESPTFGSE